MFLFASNPREASSAGFILDGTDIAALMYLLYSVSNKYLELFVVIIFVS